MTTFHLEIGDVIVVNGHKYVLITVPVRDKRDAKPQAYLQPLENIKACETRTTRDRFTGEERLWCSQHNRAANNLAKNGTRVCINHIEVRS